MLDPWPTDDNLYSAFLRKDLTLDGLAYVAVTTTGIYCRPGCPARMPLRRNVQFFPSSAAAADAGYRACKRCRPQEPPLAASPLLKTLLALVEAAPSRRWSNSGLKAMGFDPVAARRRFKKRFGKTFLDYARSHRLAKAHAALEAGADVVNAQLEAEFESPSGFHDAYARKFGRAPASARSCVLLRSDWIDTPLGPMIAICDDTSLHMLEFSDREKLEAQLERYRRRLTAVFLPGETSTSRQLRRELDAYFAGEQLAFSIRLATTGTPFQEAVWAQLRALSVGSTISYRDLACVTGFPTAVRAVANANAMNRCAIVVPCHRVLGADGSLTGYAGGLPRKQ
jgi:AraC family transcriptional regulator, regulatory protein of adaptative response / methylated-DNA-[protein]-cysteine methyltransferase